MRNAGEHADFSSAKERLEQIVASVSDESLPLDDALDLFEEAVSLGLQVSDLLEEGIDPSAAANADEPESGGPSVSG